jgi:glycosyltransferase involved in cell wall biosynthesis
LYHRHGRFVIAGALLARKLKSPLILEYNGSEVWVAKNWDPSRFKVWLRLCEEYSIRSATLIVVVSEPLKRELMNRGITEERIVVTPNGVDAALFQPAREAGGVREALGFSPDDVVAAFVGSFSYWHGIPVLQDAADRLLAKGEEDARLRKLRFLLVGDGLLKGDATTYLQRWIDCGKVVFTGSVPHVEVPAYLDVADILLSPHIPFADGSEFFGSPTKLFEYMAMQKAIVASNLGQIGQVLSHERTGWLVKPGSVDELVEAIAYLAVNPLLRERLGREARAAAQASHSWKRNAEIVIRALQTITSNSDRKHACETAAGDLSVTAKQELK